MGGEPTTTGRAIRALGLEPHHVGQTEKEEKFRVLLPWQAQGNVVTKLKKKCAALCDWIVTFEEGAITKYMGVVPTDLFKEIQKKTILE